MLTGVTFILNLNFIMSAQAQGLSWLFSFAFKNSFLCRTRLKRTHQNLSLKHLYGNISLQRNCHKLKSVQHILHRPTWVLRLIVCSFQQLILLLGLAKTRFFLSVSVGVKNSNSLNQGFSTFLTLYPLQKNQGCFHTPYYPFLGK